MSERRPDPESGLLLYLRTSSLQEVEAGINEMRGLVQLRNQLVSHLRDQVQFQVLLMNENRGRVCVCVCWNFFLSLFEVPQAIYWIVSKA
jgi:hypothetical protein